MVGYFSKYVDAFRDLGVQVNGITPMNEPLNYQGGYPCMYLDPVDAAALIAQGLGQAMRDRSVIIMAYVSQSLITLLRQCLCFIISRY